MATFETLIAVLCVLGSLQGLLIASALASIRDGDRLANRLLATIVGAASVVLLVILASHVLSEEVARWLELVETAMWVFSGPLVYLYVDYVARATTDRRLTLPALAQLIPGGLWITYLGFVWTQRGSGALATLWYPPVLWLILYQAFYTAASAVRWLRRSSPERGGLHEFWAPALLATLILQHAAQLARFALREQPAFDNVVPATGAIAFFALTALGLRKAFGDWSRQRARYASSALEPEAEAEIAERIERLMVGERPFLEPDLSASRLAELAGVPKTHLSQALNHHMATTFQDLVAGYRIRNSESLLADPTLDHLTIEAIGRRSGFRSRSAFYEAFRKAHDMTPAEFRRRAASD